MSAARIIAVSTLLLALVTRLLEDSFLYHPVRRPGGDWDAPSRSGLRRDAADVGLAGAAQAGARFEEVAFTAADGVALSGWLLKGEGGNAKATIIYFHGNAGNIAHRWGWIRALSTIPADVLAVDYRGYGKSEGEPSERGIYLDAEAAYRFLVEEREERNVAPSRLVIYGKSLGGAPACELALRFPCAGLILQSAFTSAPDMANEIVPIFPAGWFVRTSFDNLSKVARIERPTLVVHSRHDELVPFRMGERLFDAARGPKEFAPFEGSGHNALVVERRAELIELFRRFVESCVR